MTNEGDVEREREDVCTPQEEQFISKGCLRVKSVNLVFFYHQQINIEI